MAMFQILTQEGWIEVMHDTMGYVDPYCYWLVAAYFITYHLFATVVSLHDNRVGGHEVIIDRS